MTVKNYARCMAIGYTTYNIWDSNFSVSRRLPTSSGIKWREVIYIYFTHYIYSLYTLFGTAHTWTLARESFLTLPINK